MMAVVPSVAAVGADLPQGTVGSDMSDIKETAFETFDVRGGKG